VIVAVGLLGQGCGGDDKGTNPPNPPDSLMVQDFHLEDINPNSSRYQQQVSPRDYLGRLTAWYFGSAG